VKVQTQGTVTESGGSLNLAPNAYADSSQLMVTSARPYSLGGAAAQACLVADPRRFRDHPMGHLLRWNELDDPRQRRGFIALFPRDALRRVLRGVMGRRVDLAGNGSIRAFQRPTEWAERCRSGARARLREPAARSDGDTARPDPLAQMDPARRNVVHRFQHGPERMDARVLSWRELVRLRPHRRSCRQVTSSGPGRSRSSRPTRRITMAVSGSI
jgi:hypothetical protein